MQSLGNSLREAEWIAKQRKQLESEKVKRGVKRPLQETLAEATRLGQASWTAQHEKASVKLEAKSLAAKLKAYEDGFLLPSEIDDDLSEAVKIFKAKRAKIEQQHEHNYDQIKRKLAVRPPVDLAGGVVFIDPILQDVPEVKQVIRQHKMTAVSAREEARIFVVPDLKQPGQRTTWAMSLCGGAARATVDLLRQEASWRCHSLQGSCRDQEDGFHHQGFRNVPPSAHLVDYGGQQA